jgi:hypothetical protein
VTPADAPARLADRLATDPEAVFDLVPPFVLAALDQRAGELRLHTDYLGVGRLLRVDTPWGHVWSNRPVAALRFAGLRAEPDDEAWLRIAGCDWAMGDRTAYRGVSVVPPATSVCAARGSTTTRSLDPLAALMAGPGTDPLTDDGVEGVVAGLTATVRSYQRLWPTAPQLNLSGGMDSRLVAAVFLAAGTEPSFLTDGSVAGEATTARELTARVGAADRHAVSVAAGGRVTPTSSRPRTGHGALTRGRRWHDHSETLQSSTRITRTPPRLLTWHSPPLVSGVGGELAHGYYPDDLARLMRLPLRARKLAFAQTLASRLLLPDGLSPAAGDTVRDQLDRVVGEAFDRGVEDHHALDWYYASERLRRWGPAHDGFGKVLPLLTPAYVTAGLRLSAQDSHGGRLHQAVIARCLPAWSEVPFFSPTLKQRQAAPRRAVWHGRDAEGIGAAIARDDGWGAGFDVEKVGRVWRRAAAGRPVSLRHEHLLYRVLWRETFADHAAAANDERRPTPVRAGAARPAARRDGRDIARWVRPLAVRANETPIGRTVARSDLGHWLRARVGV